MPKYTMNSDYASYVAMDVHSRSVTVRALDLATSETRTKRFAGKPDAAKVSEWAAAWLAEPTLFAYESGPCGFQLQRDFAAMGRICEVIAVSSIPRSTEDKALKDDRRDARRLLSEIAKPDGKAKAVYVPSTRIESLRDLTRARHDAVKASKRSKQLVAALLTRYGYIWDERTPTGRPRKAWGAGYIEWARRAEFEQPVTRATLDRYLQDALDDAQNVKALTKACADEAAASDVKPYVDALRRLLCVDTVLALTFVASMGDFERFGRGRAVSAYYGLTPKRCDSGEKRGRNGGITKAGDSLCRTTLLEGVCGIGAAGRNVKRLDPGQQVSAAIEAEARKCNERNRARYKALIANGKHVNVAKAAVASELVRDMWIIGRMVQRELA